MRTFGRVRSLVASWRALRTMNQIPGLEQPWGRQSHHAEQRSRVASWGDQRTTRPVDRTSGQLAPTVYLRPEK